MTDNKKVKISVIVATYNGEKYLSFLLESILRQTAQPYEVIICDDCSTDATVNIIKTFKERSNKIKLFQNKKNIGVTKNFEKGLQLATGNYFAFADQDDLWRKNKLEKKLEKILSNESIMPEKKPLLVVHDLKVVDSSLETISESFWKYTGALKKKKSLNHLLVWNKYPGCSMFFNKELKEIMLLIHKEALMHDHWVGLVASAFGEIIEIKEELLKYRQHESNVTKTSRTNYFKMVFKTKEFRASYLTKERQQAIGFFDTYHSSLDPFKKQQVEDFITMTGKSYYKKRLYTLILRIFKK